MLGHALTLCCVLLLVATVLLFAAHKTAGESACKPEEFRRRRQRDMHSRPRPNVNLRGARWWAGKGPYNLQLYDSPRYYPYYEARDYMNAWDSHARCSASCGTSADGGCTVSCR